MKLIDEVITLRSMCKRGSDVADVLDAVIPALRFGEAIVTCLLTDNQLDFRSPTKGTGTLTGMLDIRESVREASIRYFGKESNEIHSS